LKQTVLSFAPDAMGGWAEKITTALALREQLTGIGDKAGQDF
jgi:hypothetical protein